jgi:hypothetical protein
MAQEIRESVIPPIRLKIEGHLIIPFGVSKWDIEKIRVVGVPTDGTYLVSETPCVHIDKTKKLGIRLRDFWEVLPYNFSEIESGNAEEALYKIRDVLKERCSLQTEYEKEFLNIYFEFCLRRVTPSEFLVRSYGKEKLNKLNKPYNDLDWVFDALMPLPQAHFYLHDPLAAGYSFVPQKMVRFDFGFWTGSELLAVEIDGSSHLGSDSPEQTDRLLQRANVRVIHILNSELSQHKEGAIAELLPDEVTKFWEHSEYKYPFNPLSDVPF